MIMFNGHIIINNNGNEYLYLYVDNYTEFSNELMNDNTSRSTIFDMIHRYITRKKIEYNGNKIFLVYNGIVIGYILTNDVQLKNPRDIIHYEYIDKLIDNDKRFAVEYINDLID